MKYLLKMATCFLGVGLLTATVANEVQYSVNKPMIISYQIAHQNTHQSPVLSAPQRMKVTEGTQIRVDLAGYDVAGIVINSIDGHELPKEAQQFDRIDSCSVRTDKNHTTGTLKLVRKPHRIACSHS